MENVHQNIRHEQTPGLIASLQKFALRRALTHLALAVFTLGGCLAYHLRLPRSQIIYTLRRLKGKRWKLLQRFNYLLVTLVFFHTFAYQIISHRDPIFTSAAIACVIAALAAQTIGFVVHRLHTRSPSL